MRFADLLARKVLLADVDGGDGVTQGKSGTDMFKVRNGKRSLGPIAIGLLLAIGSPGAGIAGTPEQALEQFLARTNDGDRSGVSIEMDIEANLPKLHRSARLRALQLRQAAGPSVFRTLDSEGDPTVRREVIARYLRLEAEDQQESGTAISPANYKFRFQGTTGYAGQPAYVYRLDPKRKRAGLFKGELWLEPETGAVLREWGRFAKSPSWFVKNVFFVRDYLMEGRDSQSSAPRRLIVNVDTRIAGRADMTIWFARASREQDASGLLNAGPGGDGALAAAAGQ